MVKIGTRAFRTSLGLLTVAATVAVGATPAQAVPGSASRHVTAVTGAPDVTPPTNPGGPWASERTQTSAILNWQPSYDEVGVTGYRVEFDHATGLSGDSFFTQIGTTTTATSFPVTGLTPSYPYRFRVRAVDAAGNISGYSYGIFLTRPDVTPPTNPGGPWASQVTATSAKLNWQASADDLAVAGYLVEFDNGTGLSGTSVFSQIGSTTTLAFQVSGLTPVNPYRFRVRAYDLAGNISGYSYGIFLTKAAA